MHAAAASSLQLILFNLGLALLMLSAGFAAGWWVFAGSSSEDDATEDREHARAALARIRELASSVAQDVGAHSSRVQEITTDLHGHTVNGQSDIDGVVLATVAEMMKANEQLQSQLASAEQKLQQQAEEIELHAADARTDPLTKVNNRRAFDAEVERRFAEWKRLQTPYSIFLIDVDHFKKFNDVHGHQAGDEVLRGVARALRGAMREMDIVCRYGGEEFAVIMPATEGEPAHRGAERGRAAIEAATFQFEGTPLKVTASVGLAEIGVGEDNASLIRRADEALYASKKAGRNNAHFHDGQRSLPIRLGQSAAANPDASEQQAPAETPKAAVTTPALATLPSHAVFCDELRRRVAESQRFQVPLSLMLIHVDDLARFNSQFGAEVGEYLLDTVAQYLQVLLRDMDLLARYADGRFSLMLPGSTLEASGEVARRLRRAVVDFAIPMKSGTARLTVSVGFAQLATGESSDALTGRSERALAAAIANGPDAVFVHDGQNSRRVIYEDQPVGEAKAV